MRFAIDSGKLLYALGVAFAAAALLYFSRDVVFGLSITVKAALLFLAFVALFLAGLTTRRDVLDVVAFALAGVTYVVFVGYVVLRYGPSETGTFLLLSVSAALFVALGYLLREGAVTVPRRQATTIVAGLLLVGVALVGLDAVGGGVTYDVATESSVTVDPPGDGPTPYSRDERRVGTVTASNGFVFTRALDLPDVRGCLVGPGTERADVYLSYDYPGYDRPDTIGGGATREFPVVADFAVDRNRTEPVTYAVERGGDCGADRSAPTLLVAVGDERRAD
ncbi:DUF1109 domain-containing protein [Haloarcula onubensis]|uniref:DUF1109 domain-containing protein n=1 Tax=Haloarcula onubensis TaxID=2950539 RepID=A0ABU2FQY4_9EURY|nr:DUF1109 domain-containing protein [Halomicroarcula sp. S3CR25-11]MDS0282591.1 DUF1109 domain-containing protein [Halomicroarcula sp. S3CR25-11]